MYSRLLAILTITLASVLLLVGGCSGPSVDDRDVSIAPLGIVNTLGTVSVDTVIVLERTVCFGTCPIYELAVYGDGSVVYNGIANVETEGTVRAKLGYAAVQDLIAAFENADYFSFPDPLPCPNPVTDMPTVRTGIRLGESSKQIDRYVGCGEYEGKERLEQLEQEIERIVEADHWIGPRS